MRAGGNAIGLAKHGRRVEAAAESDSKGYVAAKANFDCTAKKVIELQFGLGIREIKPGLRLQFPITANLRRERLRRGQRKTMAAGKLANPLKKSIFGKIEKTPFEEMSCSLQIDTARERGGAKDLFDF